MAYHYNATAFGLYTVTARDAGGTTTYSGRFADGPAGAIRDVQHSFPRQPWWDGATWTAEPETPVKKDS